MFDINQFNINDDLWYVIENDKDYFKEELYKEINVLANKAICNFYTML